MSDKKTTPMMKQFYDLKAKYPDAVFLFRCGDFYESFDKDAEKCADILDITLTRGKDNIKQTMFPYHALDTYLPKLVRNGCRVAICDQQEDPKVTKKLAKKGITELITPTPSPTPLKPIGKASCTQLELNFT